jgi:serine O-acetyltransferase
MQADPVKHESRTPAYAPVCSDRAPEKALPFWGSLAADVIAHVEPTERPTSGWRWPWIALKVLIGSSGFHIVFLYRLAHTARMRLGWPGRLVSALLFRLGRHGYGCSLASTARLHGGLMLPHPQGIVIGPGVVVGPRAWVFQNVTLGGAPGRSGSPRVGADARIFAGAVVSGPVTLGNNVVIGANLVIDHNVPSHSLIRSARVTIQSLPARYRVNTTNQL